MENVVPPFKVDVAGTFLLPAALREAREQYRNEQISLLTLRAVEDAEIRNLVDRLKAEGLKVVTDGRFRSDAWPLDFMCGLVGIRFRDDRKTSVELTGRIDVHHHPVLDDFVFLTGVTGGDVIAKQVLPAPSRLLAELMKDANRTELDSVYPDREILLVDLAQTYQKLIMELYRSGCRYLQLDDATRTVTDNAIRVNNMALENLPADLFIAFHSPTEMLFLATGDSCFFPRLRFGMLRQEPFVVVHPREAICVWLRTFPLSRGGRAGRVESQDRPDHTLYSFAPFLAVHTQCRSVAFGIL